MPASHVIDYEIHGDDMQLLEIELDPGETVIAEAGWMCFMEEDIAFETKMGDGSAPVRRLLWRAEKHRQTRAHRGVDFHDALHAPRWRGQAQGRLCRALSGQDHRRGSRPIRRGADLRKGRLSLRRARHFGRHRFQPQTRHRALRRRRLHPAAPARRRAGLLPRGRHRREARACAARPCAWTPAASPR